MSTARSDKHCPVPVLRGPVSDFKPEVFFDTFPLHQAEECEKEERRDNLNAGYDDALQGSHKADLKKRLFSEKDLIDSHLPTSNQRALVEV